MLDILLALVAVFAAAAVAYVVVKYGLRFLGWFVELWTHDVGPHRK